MQSLQPDLVGNITTRKRDEILQSIVADLVRLLWVFKVYSMADDGLLVLHRPMSVLIEVSLARDADLPASCSNHSALATPQAF